MARHRGKSRHPLTVLGAVAAAVLLVGGTGTYAVMKVASSPAAGHRGDATTSSTTPATGRAAAAPSSTTGSPTTSTPTGPPAAATSALQDCVTTVRAQEGVAKAAASSAAHWTTHTDAQRRYDAGTFTLAQTTAAWAASKAKGPADLRAFATAGAAAKQAAGGCGQVVARTKGTELAAKAAACSQRSTALAAVVSTGTKVNNQWSAHQTMMAHKAHTDGVAYRNRWLAMVRDAQPALAAYRAAVASAAKAPACSA